MAEVKENILNLENNYNILLSETGKTDMTKQRTKNLDCELTSNVLIGSVQEYDFTKIKEEKNNGSMV